ncbi:C4-dicarboxylate anaerobic carrier [Leminorella richardii]|uniref:C4-dicarboxylate anaerobic carrier n=2 Tax=Leminorella richardii TaxID=158841 RepID=A0A2X4XWI5_9GAMM|nr:C4-dicarboxylate anaerobic carrier [Leminorella richardii]
MDNAQHQGKPESHTPDIVRANRRSRMPDTLIIIFFIGIFVSALTYFIPVGSFQIKEVHYLVEGVEKARKVIDPTSFSYATDPDGQPIFKKIALFASGDGIGLLNFPFEGLASGDKYGSAIGIIMFMLVIGGAFGIVMRTGTIDNGILRLIDKTRGNEILFIPAMFFLFSLGGAVFGMGEEAIAFAIIIAPLMVRLGYDSITTVMVTYVATQIGFATSWMNPFSVVIAQGIADVPVLSGSTLRICLWLGFTLFGTAFTMAYARKIKRAPEKSYSYHSDNYFRERSTQVKKADFGLGYWLVLLTIVGVMVWVVWGVVAHGWYIPEIAGQFFAMGVITAIIGVLFRLNAMTLNDAADAFKEGATVMIAPALLVGFAKGIMLLISGSGASDPSVLNTVLNSTAGMIGGMHDSFAAWCMYTFQSIFNFFVPSGSGQAALTMPLMAPLSDLIGVTRQVSVLAFQLGDGFTNVVIPTSASLMGTLGVCRVDWGNWIRFSWRFMLWLFIFSSIVVIGAQMGGYA